MVTSISVALAVAVSSFRQCWVAKSAVPSADRTEQATASDEDPESRAVAPAYQKVLSNQSYTLRKRPAMVPAAYDKVGAVSN